MLMLIPGGVGELIDKITILRIKLERLTSPEQLKNVQYELELLENLRIKHGIEGSAVEDKTADLKAINAALWDIEDDIRDHERRRDFGPRFIELARSVYVTNDRRAAVKREINALFGSAIKEEKSYASY